jgi:multidrug resistance efflux pump
MQYSKGDALEFDLDKRQAEARKANAEAKSAEIKAVDDLFELQKKLQAARVVLLTDAAGNFQLLPADDSVVRVQSRTSTKPSAP